MAILVTGANGQIGTNLVRLLREKYGRDQVIASDIIRSDISTPPFLMLDILNVQRIREIIEDREIDQIYHLAAILSANGEWNPMKTWNVNLNGYLSILQISVEMGVKRVFFPSTIAVHGKSTPKVNTPQYAPMDPSTVYGMSKIAGENWSHYYHQRYGLDVRSLRYPGIIGYDSMPGGGTTDYAVDIFYQALEKGRYTCFLKPDTRLPMMYMPDAMRATMELMHAPSDKITIRQGYNLTGMSFTPEELAAEIKKHIPSFEIDYHPDFRQKIAESWSESIDDAQARQDWDWQPQFDLAAMTRDILEELGESKFKSGGR